MSNATDPLAWGRRLAGLGLIAALGLSLVACGGDDDDDDASTGGDETEEPADSGSDSGGDPYDDGGSGAEEPADEGAGSDAAGGEYEITEIAYTDATAAAGSTLTINDTSGTAHTFTADDGAFDVPVPGDSIARFDVPAEAGDYPFHCEIHPSMQATLTVE